MSDVVDTVTSAVGDVFQAVGSLVGVDSSVSDAQQNYADVVTAQNEVSQRDARRNAAAEARRKRAKVLAMSNAAGLSNSSASLGSQSAISGNLSGVNAQQGYATNTALAVSDAQQRISDAQQQQQMWSTIGSTALQIGTIAAFS